MTSREGEQGVPDARLAESAREGSRRALRRIYERFADDLYRLAVRVTADEQIAKEVVQDLFVGLPEALDSYEEQDQFGAWLRTITLNLARMTYRSHAREKVGLDEAPPQTAGANLPNRIVDRELLRDAIEDLSPPLRTVFVLKEMEGHTHVEIGKMLGVSPGASRVRLHRAKKELRDSLTEAGHDR